MPVHDRTLTGRNHTATVTRYAVKEGSMAIFTTRAAAAEEFVAGDPFVVNGVVISWTLREWNEVLAP